MDGPACLTTAPHSSGNPLPTPQAVINHPPCHTDAPSPREDASYPTMQRQEPRDAKGGKPVAVQRRIIFPILHSWAADAERSDDPKVFAPAVSPNKARPAQADPTSSTTSVEAGAGCPPRRSVNLQASNHALDVEPGSSRDTRGEGTKTDQQDKLNASMADEIEASSSYSAVNADSSPARPPVVATARLHSPRLAERRRQQPFHPRSILHPPSPPRSPRSSPPLPSLTPITSFSSTSSCESIFSSAGAALERHVDFAPLEQHDAPPSSCLPPEEWLHRPKLHLAPRSTVRRARSSSEGSAALPSSPSTRGGGNIRIGGKLATVRRHDSEPTSLLSRSVSFDPCVWVVEYDEGSQRRDKGDKWFSPTELERFKSDAVAIVQRHASSAGMGGVGAHLCTPTMRGSPHCARWRARCPNSSLSDIFLNSDDEDEDHKDGTDMGSSTEEAREVKASTNVPSKKSFLQKLIPCGGLPFSESHVPQKQQSVAETEICSVLIVDAHAIFRTLLTRAVQALLPHDVVIDVARSSDEALRKIEQAVANKNSNFNKDSPHGDRQGNHGGDGEVPLHGYDIIVVEERLSTGITVAGSPTRSRLPPAQDSVHPSNAATNPHEDEDGSYTAAVPQVQSAGDDLVQRRGLPPGASGSRLIERLTHEERRASERLLLPRGRDATTSPEDTAQPPSQLPLQRGAAGVGDAVGGRDAVRERIRFSLLIGLSAHLEEDGESLRKSGADMVWEKPPPPMDCVLRKQVLDALMNKRGRGRHHLLSGVPDNV